MCLGAFWGTVCPMASRGVRRADSPDYLRGRSERSVFKGLPPVHARRKHSSSALYVCWVCLASKNKALKRPCDPTRRVNRASVYRHTSKFKDRLDKRQKKDPNSEYILVVRRDQIIRVAAREHTLAPPGRHRPRHSRMSLTGCQFTPAICGAFYHPIDALYQLQPSFHLQ